MELNNSKLKLILQKINFYRRYKILSENFQYNDSFQNYGTDQVLKLIEGFNYKANYNKSENFFRIREEISSFRFQLNISLKYGIVELIFGIWHNDIPILDISGPWGPIARFGENVEEKIKLPAFRNYEDLQEILKEAFSIYEDFKKELLKNENS